MGEPVKLGPGQEPGRSPNAGVLASDGRHAHPDRPVSSMTLGQLVGEITGEVTLLAKKQIALVKAELKADLKSEAKMVGGLSLAAITALVAINMFFVTAILALAQVMPAWGAGLVVAGALLGFAAIFALVGWQKRVRAPLAKTRETLKEDVEWTRERFA